MIAASITSHTPLKLSVLLRCGKNLLCNVVGVQSMQHENHEVFTHSSTVLSWRVAAMHIYIQDQNMEKRF